MYRKAIIEYLDALADEELAEVWRYAEERFGYRSQSERVAKPKCYDPLCPIHTTAETNAALRSG